jgi:hypothetical protein
MSIENYKNPLAEGGEYYPDWLGGEQVLAARQVSDQINNKYTVTLNGEVNGVRYGDCPRPNHIYVLFKVGGLKKMNRIEITQFVKVFFAGTFESGQKMLLDFEYKDAVFNKSENSAVFLDPGQNGNISYYSSEEEKELRANEQYGISLDGTAGVLLLKDCPSNVNEQNFGYNRILFTSYLSVVYENQQRQVLGCIYWSYNFDFAKNKWEPTLIGRPYFSRLNDFSPTAKRVLKNNNQL